MHRSPTSPTSPDILALAEATRHSDAIDAVSLSLSDAQWIILGTYLQPICLPSGQALMEQGVMDRAVYFVETGSLTVHHEDDQKRERLAIVSEGSMLGEGAFFSHLPRSATVRAGCMVRLWRLTPLRFRELSQRDPAIALELTVAMATVMARRMYPLSRRDVVI
jgi:CRP/FNR family cyclic AMP-dependent transcriptional regulator